MITLSNYNSKTLIPKWPSNFSWRNSHVHERSRPRSQAVRPRSPTQPFLNNSKHPHCNEATSSGRISGSLPSARAWCRGPLRPPGHLRESSFQLLRRGTICGQLLASSLDTRYLIRSRSGGGGGLSNPSPLPIIWRRLNEFIKMILWHNFKMSY